MDVSVVGLGYVGSTVAGCLAQPGRHVIGYDPAILTNDALLEAPVVRSEAGLRERIAAGLTAGTLHVARDTREAVTQSRVTMLCVGTPLQPDGKLLLDQLELAARQVGEALQKANGYHLVVVRSTVPPGTTRQIVAETITRASGRRISQSDLGLAFQPEFLREGTAVQDFFNPPMTVFGTLNWDRKPLDFLRELYRAVDAPLYQMSPEGAEMVKLVSNAFHALKVAFANEVGHLCLAHGIDSSDVMDVFIRDNKLNASPAYLRPGFAFGGPCLPKDLSALVALADALDLPLLKNISASNEAQIERAVTAIAQTGSKRVGIVGITHKRGTGDLRGSPALMLIDRLLAQNYQVTAFDPAVTRAAHPLVVESLEALAAASDVLVLVEGHYEDIKPVVGERPVIELTPFDGDTGAIRIV